MALKIAPGAPQVSTLDNAKRLVADASGADASNIPDPNSSFFIPGKTTPVDVKRWDKTYTYSFKLGSANPKTGKLDGYPSKMTGFKNTVIDLNLNPQSVSIQIPFASSVIATNRGVLEENNGVVFRNISISGTTGINPKRTTRGEPVQLQGVARTAQQIFPAATSAVSALIKASNRVVGTKTPEVKEPEFEQTGYVQFWRLHNFFIEYAEHKRSHKDSRLVFSCPKDNVAYVCTPVSFDIRRDASAPMLYRYSIVLKAWDLEDRASANEGLLQGEIPDRFDLLSVKRVLDKIRQARKAVQAASNVIRGVQSDIFDALNIVNQGVLALKDVAGVGAQLIDFLPTIKSNANLLIVTNKNQWVQVFQEYDSAFRRYGVSSPDLTAFEKVAVPIAAGAVAGSVALNAALAGKMGGKPTGESGNTEGTNPGALLAVNAVLGSADLTNEISLTDLGKLPKSVGAQIQSEKEKARATTSGDIRSLVGKLGETGDNLAYASGMMDPGYAKTYGLPVPATAPRVATEDDVILAANLDQTREGFLTTLATGNIFAELPDDPFTTADDVLAADDAVITPTSAFAITVDRGATLEQLAALHLDDAARAREIAILNSLRSPYIDEDGFNLSIAQASGRSFLVRDRSQLALNQVLRVSGNGIPSSRRQVLNIEDVGNSTFRVTVNGKPNLDIYGPLSNPYINARLPGTVGSGDTLLIPSADSPDEVSAGRSTPLSDRLTFAEKVFLVDIGLTPDGDLNIGASGDVSRSFGYQNAVQAIRLIIETEQGELEWHPEHGFDAAIGQRMSSDLLTLIRERVRSAIVADPRFIDADVLVSRSGSAYTVRVEAFGKRGTGRIAVEFKIPA